MIISKFEEQVRKHPHKPAVKSAEGFLTYGELNRRANRVAEYLLQAPGPAVGSGDTVALLFGREAAMIVAMLGVLKAGKTYVPIPADYPFKRAAVMTGDCGAALVLTCTPYMDRARQLTLDNPVGPVNIDDIVRKPGGHTNLQLQIDPGEIAYILYTSGSTGRPKGVMQTRGNILYYIHHWAKRFGITAADRISLFASFGHDASVQDIYVALVNGACLYLYDVRGANRGIGLTDFLNMERITVWHSVVSLFTSFVNRLTGSEAFPYLRFVLLGGEALRAYEIEMCRKFIPGAKPVNIYGQTESSANATWTIPPGDPLDRIVIGPPLDDTRIMVVDEQGRGVSPLESGEIVVACRHLSPGYWQDSQGTGQVFLHHPQAGPLYRTGDLGRLMLDGNIEFMGRKDKQVKIRGFRVEPGEIESALLEYEGIAEAVVVPVLDGGGDTALCAYYVTRDGVGPDLDPVQLRGFVADRLPDYMIPTYYMALGAFPLTGSGKIDRKALPEPRFNRSTMGDYAAPSNPTESGLVEIWAEVLGLDKESLGIDDDFFQLGGHSLRAMTVIARVHKAFHVDIPLSVLFDRTTVRQLAEYIQNTGQDRFTAIPPAEEKEYYPLSPAQRSIYTQQQKDPQNLGYNFSQALALEGNLDSAALERALNELLHRHEGFRTAFWVVHGEVVQTVYDRVDFAVQHFTAEEAEVGAIVKDFTRPFQLDRPPLLRAALIKVRETRHIFLLDMHHMVYDGGSLGILIEEFCALYEGQSLPRPPLQYRDFAQWQSRGPGRESVVRQEKYWHEVLAGELPRLDLPGDFPRPRVQDFAGDSFVVPIDKDRVGALTGVVPGRETTPFAVMLAVCFVLLHKLSGQEDMVVGTPVAGRRHADLERVVGMFVNTLAMRAYPRSDKRFVDFLGEVRGASLAGFEHQEYPFEALVQLLLPRRDVSRHPLFDVMFILQNHETRQAKAGDIRLAPFQWERSLSHFDLMFSVLESPQSMTMTVEYATSLFKRETVQKIADHYLEILDQVVAEPHITIKDIRLSHHYLTAEPALVDEKEDQWLL